MQQVQHGNQVGFSTRLIASKLNRALLALLALLLSSMSAGLSAQAQAQTQPAGGNWPNKPVRLIVPFGSGGPDSLARILSAQLAQQTGQPWLVAAEGGGGAESLLERQKREDREALAEIKADPFVASLLAAFPGAELEVRKIPGPSLAPSEPDELED